MSAARLDELARAALLRRARRAIASTIGADASGPANGAADDHSADDDSAIPDYRAGLFVSIHLLGHLRGCIGYLEPDFTIASGVERCAASAATADPRFPSLDSSELKSASLEISVLGPLAIVTDISEVEVGRHGLLAEMGPSRGLLLPQVAVERRWSREEFASHTCAKAGLPRDAWRHGAALYRFEAEVFGEDVTRAGPEG